MIPRNCRLLPVAAILLAGMPAQSDQIVLKNGDRLTGAIVSSDGKRLTIRSEYAGNVTVPAEAIAQISSDQALHIALQDGQTIVGAVATDGDALEVRTQETGTVRLSKESVRTVRSVEAQSAYEAEIERLRNPGLLDLWSGSVDTGLSLSQGNADTSNLNIGMNAVRSSPRDRITVYAASLYATNSTTGVSLTTANAIRGGVRYDFTLHRRVFAFGSTDMEFDEFQKLDLRTVVGGGAGWHVRRSESFVFDIFGGGTLNKEAFSTGVRRTSGEIMLGQELTYKLSNRTSFREKAVFHPNLSESGEYRLTFDASAVTNLNSWLAWQVRISNRYLSNPAPGAKANDVLLSTGVRLTFGD